MLTLTTQRDLSITNCTPKIVGLAWQELQNCAISRCHKFHCVIHYVALCVKKTNEYLGGFLYYIFNRNRLKFNLEGRHQNIPPTLFHFFIVVNKRKHEHAKFKKRRLADHGRPRQSGQPIDVATRANLHQKTSIARNFHVFLCTSWSSLETHSIFECFQCFILSLG